MLRVCSCVGIAILLPFLLFVTSTDAFQSAVIPRVSSSLTAWSLPNLDPSSAFSSSTWYCEYNPTARRTVYKEYVWLTRFIWVAFSITFCPLAHETNRFLSSTSEPTEQYNFVMIRDNWDIELTEMSEVRHRRRNPLRSFVSRRALLRKIFRRKQS